MTQRPTTLNGPQTTTTVILILNRLASGRAVTSLLRRPSLTAAGLARRGRIRVGHDLEKTSLWTARNKSKIPGAVKRRFAVSKKGTEAAQFASAVLAACGYEAGGSFCVDRIQLRAETVLKERLATFSAKIRRKGLLRLHAIRLKPNVLDERRLTTERFSSLQRPDTYHWFIQGRPVYQETYTEVCALSEKCTQQIRSLAKNAKGGYVDLSGAAPIAGCGVRDQEVGARECELMSFIGTLVWSCCDAIPNGETVDGLASDPDVGREEDDGGGEGGGSFRFGPYGSSGKCTASRQCSLTRTRIRALL